MSKPFSSDLHEADIRAQLERILASETFSQSESLRRFLKYVVERTLAGQADELKEYNVGVDVLGRGESYDPRTDTIVRVQAGRLRSKLHEYYRNHGSQDPVRIEIPKGSYVPDFQQVNEEAGVSGAGAPRPRSVVLWVGAGALVLTLLGVLGMWLLHRTGTEPSVERPGAIQSIAVLPFADMSPNQDQEYFADGVAEELTNTLSHLQGIYVAPRTSAFQFKGQPIGIRQIGEHLGVDVIVQGSVRKADDNLRVTAQLLRAGDGANLWSATYDRTEGDVFAVQEELARAITNALQVPLLYNPKEYWTGHYTDDPRIYEIYLRRRHRLNRGEEADIAMAIDLFEDVLAQDGDYAPAYAGLVDAYARLAFLGLASPPEVEAEKRAAERAVGLDTNLPDAQLALAAYEILFRWDWEQGERAVRRALELDPADPEAHEWYAHLMIATGRLDEGLAEARRARELDALSPSPATTVALALYLKQDFRQAQDESQRILRWAPDSKVTRVILGLTYRQQSRFEEAIAEFQELERTTAGNSAASLSFKAQTYAIAGREEEARNALDELKGLAELRYIAPSYFARVHLGLGENDVALDWLEASAENRSLPVATIKTDPDMDPLRGEPRFKALLAKAGLE
ncbi:MAG: TPR end-of-group domain-containing protein [Vicinamibacteria bacterium]